MEYKEIIRTAILESLEELSYPLVEFNLSKPKDLKNGDYCTNILFVLAKSLSMKPDAVGVTLKGILEEKLKHCVSKIEIVKGYINFLFTEVVLKSIVSNAILFDSKFCSNFSTDTRTHIIEFSSPNIAKPFTVGHLRSTIIGDSIARLLAHAGYTVVKDNHLGDWGTQFGKMIVAIKKWGDESVLLASKEPVKDLVALYIKFHEEAEKDKELENEARKWFTDLENGNLEAIRLWTMCVELSMVEFEKIYQRLGVKFDTILGESFFQDKMGYMLDDLREKNLTTIGDEGAELIFFSEDTKLPPLMILKKDGSTLYQTRDLATDRYRKQTYGNDIVIINEVGSEQSGYFKQIYETERLLGYFSKDQRIHVKHGLYRLADSKMSTRAGKVIWLEDVLDGAFEQVKIKSGNSISDEDSNKIAIGAVKFYDLFRSCEMDIVFNLDEMLSLKGDTGPYVQYAVVKINSLIEKAETAGVQLESPTEIPFGEAELAIAKMIDGFGEAVSLSVSKLAPHHLAGYLIDLAREYNSYYAQNYIIKDKNIAGVAISKAVACVLTLGLSLIGIEIPSRM